MPDCVFSLDTTGSMYPCILQVRHEVQNTVKQLFTEIPDLRIGVIAHGDYCDAPPTGNYVIRMLDLTDDEAAICKFVRETPNTSGGDADECYELVLNEARRLSWRAGVPKVLALIGDANPHGPDYPDNKKKLDWKNELDFLTESQIRVYGVQALNYSGATSFYREIARRTKGLHLHLNQFADVEDVLRAVCHKQLGDVAFQKYVDKVQTTGGRMSRSLSEMYGTLLGKAPVKTFKTRDLEAVDPGRFQVLRVRRDMAIKDFVEKNGATFRKGRGFYQFTKREEVQEKKEVILVDQDTGDMFSGVKARKMVGIPFGKRGMVSPGSGSVVGYDVFIQSTSSNRKLQKGTQFLYEVE